MYQVPILSLPRANTKGTKTNSPFPGKKTLQQALSTNYTDKTMYIPCEQTINVHIRPMTSISSNSNYHKKKIFEQ